jgi:Protein of unknown function (DUF4239)
MSYALGLLIVIVCALAVTAASLLVDRRISIEARRRHHEVGNSVFQVIGVMFSVILAFVFSEVWSEYNTAKQAIGIECGALHGAAMLANAMPDRQGRLINEKLFAYTQKVVNTEWPMMAGERRSTTAAEDLRAALDTTARLHTNDASDLANRTEILTLLAQAHAAREMRTFQLRLGIPRAMWGVLITIAFILVAFVVLAGTELPATILFGSTFAVTIAMVLVLVQMLDYPFEGALALGNGDFVKLNGEIAGLLALSR